MMRSEFLDTAAFSLVPITERIELSVLPAPEPSTARLLGLGLARLARRQRRLLR